MYNWKSDYPKVTSDTLILLFHTDKYVDFLFQMRHLKLSWALMQS